MSREKQIDEMAKDLAKHSFFYNGGCLMNYSNTAKLLYEAGYRKQSEDTIEVVRCKDCVYCEEKHYEELGDIPYIKLVCKWSNYSHQPNDYCSLAERK